MNFVRLDYDKPDDVAFAQRLGVRSHPAFAFVAPTEAGARDAVPVEQRAFGPLTEQALRERLDLLIASSGG